MALTLGVKYCGGCNVQFDRVELVDYIREHYPDQLNIVYTSSGEPFDLLLVMNACQVACADLTGLTPRMDTYIVREADEAKPGEDNPVIRWIQKYLDNS